MGGAFRWTFASEAELLGLAPDADRSNLAVDLLKVRAGIAQHQLAAAHKDRDLQQQAVEYAEQDVESRKKVVEQQDTVADILRELLAHMKRWRELSVWGLRILGVELVLSLGFLIWLFILAGADKISDWAFPTAIFALALFVISPVVLLILERPLKGVDEAGWPGGGLHPLRPHRRRPHPAGTAPAATTPAATPPAGTAPAAPTSTTTSTTTFAAQRPG